MNGWKEVAKIGALVAGASAMVWLSRKLSGTWLGMIFNR